MNPTLSPLAFAAAVGLALATLLGLSVLLPQDRYYRYQSHDSGTTRKADWIYERLHFDPTPVNVALIGTSRTAGGLSAEAIERDYCRTTGRRIHVANLGIPEMGRNMHYAIAKEAARTKSPDLFIVEINEVEARKPHPGFVVLADAADVVRAPAAINLNYFADLIRLPGRQIALFFESLGGRAPVRARFDPRAYDGPYFDRTRTIKLLDGREIDKRVARSAAEMDALYAARLSGEAPLRLLPGPLQGLEYSFSRTYLRALKALARENGGDIAYAFLPAYRAPAVPAELLAELDVRVDYDLGGASAGQPDLWFDATHWNARGASIASLRLAAALARTRPRLGEAGCGRPAN